MIDIHSHILPGIDDGSKNIEMTLNMLRNAEKDGTSSIIATPHFCRGYAELEYTKVKDLSEKINKLIKDEGINLDLYYGQEVFYSQSIIEDYKKNIIGTLNGTRYLLFELPLRGDFDKKVLDSIYELKILGVEPILAHPERYQFMQKDTSSINELIDEGILFQVNSGSLEGVFGREAKKTANIFLKNGIYNFIGSDAHNEVKRKTGIKKGIDLAISKNKIYETLFDDSSKKMLENKAIKLYGKKIKKKKGLKFFMY